MGTALDLAQGTKGQGAVTLLFCPARTESLAFDPQAMRAAATEKLPLVSLVETGFDAEIQAHDAAPAAVDSGYYPRIKVDGCDVVAVFRVAQEAVRRAREGHGPALIECVVAQADGIFGDAASSQSDPVAFMEQYLRRRELWSDEWARSIMAGFTRDLDEALASRPGAAGFDDPFDNVYSSDIARPQSRSQARLPQPIPAQ
jgi:TPP-dependent pyruvate/acetoin dehydrogenase alpha subunit